MSSQKKSYEQNCFVCRAPLVYSPEVFEGTCFACGKVEPAHERCSNGHYICNECHQQDGHGIIKLVCTKTRSDNPIEIMEEIFQYPQIKMHGPEHHFLVPAALLTALKNHGENVSENYLRECEQRASKIPGGACGFWGSCGAGVGVGIAFAIFLGSTPKKKVERQVSIWATSRALAIIADGVEQCCKHCTRIAIEVACELFKEKYNISLPCTRRLKCDFSSSNERCAKSSCKFYESC